MVIGCHNCRKGRGEWCVACRRVEHDDVRIKREAHNISPELTPDTAAPAPSKPESATRLPSEVEDRLRECLCAVTQFDALEVLLAWHVLRGGTPSTFGELTARVAVAIANRGTTVSRAFAWAKWKTLARKLPALAAVRSWGSGHGGAEAAVIEERPTQGELFE